MHVACHFLLLYWDDMLEVLETPVPYNYLSSPVFISNRPKTEMVSLFAVCLEFYLYSHNSCVFVCVLLYVLCVFTRESSYAFSAS